MKNLKKLILPVYQKKKALTCKEVSFINNFNKQHESIEFDYEVSYGSMPFLDTMVQKEENTKSKITIYRRLTGQKASLQARLEHEKSLKDSIHLQPSFLS